MLITQMRVLQDLFHTTPLTGNQWAICLVPGVVLLILGELVKVILRARRAHDEATVSNRTAARRRPADRSAGTRSLPWASARHTGLHQTR